MSAQGQSSDCPAPRPAVPQDALPAARLHRMVAPVLTFSQQAQKGRKQTSDRDKPAPASRLMWWRHRQTLTPSGLGT